MYLHFTFLKFGIDYLNMFKGKRAKYLCWHGGKYYSSVATPKITTHYTVHPRENDSRWKGMFKIR